MGGLWVRHTICITIFQHGIPFSIKTFDTLIIVEKNIIYHMETYKMTFEALITH